MATVDPARDRGLQDYRKKLLEHKEVESRLKESKLNISSPIRGYVVQILSSHFHKEWSL